jgi:hypothetical protein
MDQGESKIAERSQNLRRAPGTQTRTIFSKGHIADVVRGVLNAEVDLVRGQVSVADWPQQESEG